VDLDLVVVVVVAYEGQRTEYRVQKRSPLSARSSNVVYHHATDTTISHHPKLVLSILRTGTVPANTVPHLIPTSKPYLAGICNRWT